MVQRKLSINKFNLEIVFENTKIKSLKKSEILSYATLVKGQQNFHQNETNKKNKKKKKEKRKKKEKTKQKRQKGPERSKENTKFRQITRLGVAIQK